MPKLKMFQLYNYCDNVVFQFDLSKITNDDLEWIPYRLKLTVDKDVCSIEGFYLHTRMIERWIAKMEELIKEREKYTFFDEAAGRSISTVPDSEKTTKIEEYQIIECYLGEDLDFEIKMQNTEDYRDEIFVNFEIWLNAAVIKERRQGYFIGFRFTVKYDDVRAFCDCLKKQYEELTTV